MSATTTIKYTRNGRALLNYANSNKRKAHNGYDMPRVLALSAGLGLTPEETEAKMKELWKAKQTRKRNKRNEIEAYSVVQSFDPKQFDWKNAKDIQKVNDLGNKLAKRAYAGRLYTVSTQADGTHHVLHNHITVCSQDVATLKSLRGIQTRHVYVKQINDTILREAGYTPVKAQHLVHADTLAMRKMREKHPEKPLKVDVIRNRLDKLMSRKDLTTWDGLIKEAKKEKLDVKAKFNKQGKISRVSYRLLDTTDELRMQKGIRPRKLGEIYEKSNIEQFLQENTKYERNRERDKQNVRSTVKGISATFGAKLDRGAFNDTSVQNGQNRNENSNRHQNAVKASDHAGGSRASFKGITVYYPRSTSAKLKKPRNGYKHFSHQPEPNYPSFNSTRRRLTQYTSELDELKRVFKQLDSTPDQVKLWRNLVFDDDIVEGLKKLFAEYADIKATPRLRQRANGSSRKDSRSPHNAPDNEIGF